jgi:hypothetical protein
MPVLASLYRLCRTDTCVAYIHTLRWEGRLLPCPRCQSYNVAPWSP